MLIVGLPGLIKEAVVAALAETKQRSSDSKLVGLSVGTPKTPKIKPPTWSASASLQSTSSSCSSEEQLLEEPKSMSPKLMVCLDLYHV